MLKTAGGFNTPLQQLFLMEERVRLSGSALPEENDLHNRFHGIKCIIKGVHCVVDMSTVAEVFEDKTITPIPGSVEWIEGVMNYRGTLVPVYNTHRYLLLTDSINKAIADKNGSLIIIRYENALCAIRVNKIIGMQKFMQKDFREITPANTTRKSIFHYMDSSISTDKDLWYRIDSQSLLDGLTSENPRLNSKQRV